MPTAYLLELVIPVAIVWMAMLLSPLLTRRDLFFSVVVPLDFRDTVDAKAILRRYQLEVTGLFATILAVGWLTRDHLGQSPIRLWIIVAVLAVYPLFYRARRRSLPHAIAPSMVREASLGSGHEATLEGLGWELLPFVGLAATGAYLLSHWSELPPRFPIHYDLAGTPNGWADRTLGGVLGVLLVQLFALALVIGARFIALRARRGRVTGPGADEDLRLRRRVSRVLLAFEYLSVLLVARLALNPLLPGAPGSPAIVGAGIAVVSLGLVVLLLLLVIQSRRKRVSTGGDGTDQSRWRGGIFYVNPDDPAIFVERRFGFGWTLNFGRPMAWAIMVLLLAFIAMTALLGTKH